MRKLILCLLLMFAGLDQAAARDAPMTFWAAPDTDQTSMSRMLFNSGRYRVYAVGVITDGTAEAFRDFIERRGIKRATVYLHSPGGSLLGGIHLGQIIREYEFGTEVGISEEHPSSQHHSGPAICASACAYAYAYAGGVFRYYDTSNSRIGIHQFYNRDDNHGDIGAIQQVSGLVVAYLNSMGVDSNAFALATLAGGESMIWLNNEDAGKLRLSNNGRLPTASEIKLASGSAYLRLNQDTDDGTIRVLLTCVSGQRGIDAGIVTTNDNSHFQAETNSNSLLEFDKTSFYELDRHRGVNVVQETLWVGRALDTRGINSLLRADRLGVWLHNGGALRWGLTMDLSDVRPAISNFFGNCRP